MEAGGKDLEPIHAGIVQPVPGSYRELKCITTLPGVRLISETVTSGVVPNSPKLTQSKRVKYEDHSHHDISSLSKTYLQVVDRFFFRKCFLGRALLT